MASLLSHPAIPLAVAVGLGKESVPTPLLAAAVAGSLIPDLDAVGLRLGIPYGHLFGHRGFSHSICFGLLLGLVAFMFAGHLHARPWVAFVVVAGSVISHDILDALTNGGLGVAFFSPFSNERYFFPWRPLVVSPIGLRPFFSPWGLAVIRSEVAWVWLPSAVVAVTLRALRRFA